MEFQGRRKTTVLTTFYYISVVTLIAAVHCEKHLKDEKTASLLTINATNIEIISEALEEKQERGLALCDLKFSC